MKQEKGYESITALFTQEVKFLLTIVICRTLWLHKLQNITSIIHKQANQAEFLRARHTSVVGNACAHEHQR